MGCVRRGWHDRLRSHGVRSRRRSKLDQPVETAVREDDLGYVHGRADEVGPREGGERRPAVRRKVPQCSQVTLQILHQIRLRNREVSIEAGYNPFEREIRSEELQRC